MTLQVIFSLSFRQHWLAIRILLNIFLQHNRISYKKIVGLLTDIIIQINDISRINILIKHTAGYRKILCQYLCILNVVIYGSKYIWTVRAYLTFVYVDWMCSLQFRLSYLINHAQRQIYYLFVWMTEVTWSLKVAKKWFNRFFDVKK